MCWTAAAARGSRCFSGFIKGRERFGASDSAKSLTEQPANEHAVAGLEGTSGVGGTVFANADGRYPELAAFAFNYHSSNAGQSVPSLLRLYTNP